MLKNIFKSIFGSDLVIVGPRPVGQIWQSAIGFFIIMIGVIALVGSSSGRYFFPPPTLEELHPVSGLVAGKLEITSSGGRYSSTRIILPVQINGSIWLVRIKNYAFFDGKTKICQLKPNDHIKIWLAKKDTAKINNAFAWQIQRDGEYVLTLEQSLRADYGYYRTVVIIALSFVIIGTVLLIWGWRISVIEQRRWDSHRWFSKD